MKKIFFYLLLLSFFQTTKAQSLSLEIGNMHCFTNTNPNNQYLRNESVFRNTYFHIDYGLERKNGLVYTLGYSFYKPVVGLRLKPIPNQYQQSLEASILFSHHIVLGIGRWYKLGNSRFAILPCIQIDGRINIGDMGALSGSPQSDARYFILVTDSESGFHLVPNAKVTVWLVTETEPCEVVVPFKARIGDNTSSTVTL